MPSPTTWKGSRQIAHQSSLRDHNLAVVLQTIAAAGTLSRADVAARTGLTRATVSRLVQDLLDGEFVDECELPESSGPGRPATPLRLSDARFAGVGIEINVDYLAGRALALDGTVLGEFKEELNFQCANPEASLSLLRERTQRLLDTLGGYTLGGIVLGIPGLVDTPRGELLLAPNLQWRSVRPSEILGMDVTVLNDANLQGRAAANLRPGRNRELDSFLFLSGDIGVGSAIIRAGRADAGRHGWAGEIGHVCIEPDGPLCACGNRGCLERYAGKNAILEAAGLSPESSQHELLARVQEGHPAALRSLGRAGWALGIAISDAVNILDISDIVLGTYLAPYVPWLRDPIMTQLESRPLSAEFSRFTVAAAPPDPMPCSTGGALTALDRILEDPAAFLD